MTAPPAIKRQAAARSARDLDDDVVTEILLRLPCAAVLRARAVCKAWHRITTSAAFVAGHARRRPLELISQRQRHGRPSSALETIPLVTLDEASRQCIHVQYSEYTLQSGYTLIASCSDDGLLLFERGPRGGKDFFVCNPVTRQWAVVPRPPGAYMLPCGLYAHRPSGEHRVLCLSDDKQGSHYVCSLNGAGAGAGARRLGPAVPFVPICSDLPLHYVTHRGKLHWLRYPEVLFPMDNGRRCPEAKEIGKIIAFDTEAETFRRISRAPQRRDGYDFFLLEVDGMLAMADFRNGSMDLWVLEDYSNDASWTLRFQVDLPSPWRRACWAMNPRVEGQQDVLLLGDRRRSWVGLYHVTEKRVVKQTQLVNNDDRDTCHNVFAFRDSLERYAFFDLMTPKDQGVALQ